MVGEVSIAAERRLGAILVDANVLAEHSLADALDRQCHTRHRLGTVLVDMGLADEKTIVAALAVQRDLPVANLRQASPVETVAKLPEQLARTLSAVSLRRTPLGLEVAVGEPLDGPALAQLEAAMHEPVVMLLAPLDELRRMIDVTYATREPGNRSAGSEPSECVEEPNEHGARVLQVIVSDVVRAGAWDIHLELGPAHSKLRYRVNGVLTKAAPSLARSGAAAVLRAEYLAGAPTGSRRQFLPFTMTVDGYALRVLVTASATVQGKRVRLRVSTGEAANRGRLD